MTYVLAFFAAAVLSAILTPLVSRFAIRTGAVDDPALHPERKIHARPTPLLGGLAPFLSFALVASVFALTTNLVFTNFLHPREFLGLFLAGAILMIVGLIDDRRHLPPRVQAVVVAFVALLAVAAGFGVSFITNPFGGVIPLDRVNIELFRVGGVPYHLTLFADLLTFSWLVAAMFSTKLLDGLDGLVSGMTVIGSFILFSLSLARDVQQPGTALLAILLAGSFSGFLAFNWHPAKIFLGQGGSLWAGFMLGLLAIVSGGKIATALLILGLPLLDVVLVSFERLRRGRSIVEADRRHLHFRLLDAGLSHRQAVLLLYVVTAAFGIIGRFASSIGKVWALVLLVVLALILLSVASKKSGPAVR